MDRKEQVVSNLIWRFMERCGAQMVSFVVSIVLARLLLPEQYGQVALISVFITILNVFVDSGFGNALIQKKDADYRDFSTVFFFNVGFCLLLYAAVFLCAPLIALFYEDPSLTPLIRVLSLTIVISGVKNIQQVYVMKNLIFKKFFYATLFGTVLSAFVGIALAMRGFGVWALVFQHLTNTFVDTCVLWLTVKWYPNWYFSFQRLREMFSYGYKLLLSSLMNTVYINFRQLIIGKFYSSADLAFYNKGKQFPYLIVQNVNTSIDSVLFPVMSRAQDNKEELKKMIRLSIKTGSFIMWPLLIGLASVSESLIELLLTEKWMPCVPYLIIFCLVCGWYPIQTANLNAIKAVGRSDIFLKLEIIQSVCGIALLIPVIHKGVWYIALMFLVSSILNCMIIAYPNRKLVGYGCFQQFFDMLPILLLAVIMGAVVYCVKYFVGNLYIRLLIQVPVGMAVYTAGAAFFKFEAFYYILGMLKRRKA
ncbi:MAG TPA: flippase [Lachnospiraceae bacterium]|nr:flippase [Lachnospiraceae bacterium]